MLKEETKKQILEMQGRYPQKRFALIPALHVAHSEHGYLPREIQNEVAELFAIDPNEVHAVVTFYDMFYEKPMGKHLIHLCKNVSCMLHGSDELLQELCHKLGVEPGGTTADGEFTLLPCECLAACDKAPMLLVDDQVIGPVKSQDIDAIIERARSSKVPHCPCLSEENSL